MKKKIALILSLCMVSAWAFCGCGESEESSSTAESVAEESVDEAADEDAADEEVADITGDWTLRLINDADGNSYTLEEYAAEQGIDATGMEATYTFADDGTAVGSIGGIGVDCTYEFDGETLLLTVTENDTTSELTYSPDEDYLIAVDTASGMSSVFTRS